MLLIKCLYFSCRYHIYKYFNFLLYFSNSLKKKPDKTSGMYIVLFIKYFRIRNLNLTRYINTYVLEKQK